MFVPPSICKLDELYLIQKRNDARSLPSFFFPQLGRNVNWKKARDHKRNPKKTKLSLGVNPYITIISKINPRGFLFFQ